METDPGEALLRAWLELTATLWSREMVSGLTFNEAIVCNLLYHQTQTAPKSSLTATELCQRLNIRKSQMNQLLTGLEKQGYLTRSRSETDRRQVHLSLTAEGQCAYLLSHDRNRELISAVVTQMGTEQAETLTENLLLANSIVQNVLAARRRKGAI